MKSIHLHTSISIASSVVQSGKYFLVDLTTATDPYVATVPDFWVNDGTQCWYPRTLGERASVKRKTPQPDWFLYQCNIRGTFDSYETSRAKENVAAVQSDINYASESQTQQQMGKDHRNKRPRKRFTVDESHDSSSDASTDGIYGPTQFDTPSIPPELSANAVRTTRQVVNVPTQFFQQNAEYIERSNANALESHQSTSLFNVNSPSSTAGSSSVVRREMGERDQVVVAQPTNTECFEKIVKKLVGETFKQNETLTNLMDKLVIMDGKLNNLTLPAVLPAAENPTFLMAFLKEVEEIKELEQQLLEKDNYYQLVLKIKVRMIRSLGGTSVSDCLQRAWKSVFAIKVMAHVNWEGKPKKGSILKHGLQHSIITTAVFEGIQTGSRKPNKLEMENDTRKIMKGMPEKYRIKCLAENQDRMDVDNGPRNGPPAGIQAHTVYFSAANNVDYSAANTVDCSAANTVDYSAANTTRIIQGNSLLIHLLSDLRPVVDQINALLNILWTFVFRSNGCSFSDVNWAFVLGRQMEVQYGRSTERTSGRTIIIRITSTSDVQSNDIHHCFPDNVHLRHYVIVSQNLNGS
ncbi:hypothetical protein OUZ56_017577 [Daphnia magna]|uniref:DUF4806 domain-containing protein n=1 Tax=Daphnia magna TaxID=35525 RepID=A0ABR0AT48_9CRUS|nr:hypothetical protein OUZ56_017577 [Daphnia magna]